MPGKNCIRKSIKKIAATKKRSQRITAPPFNPKTYLSPPVSHAASEVNVVETLAAAAPAPAATSATSATAAPSPKPSGSATLEYQDMISKLEEHRQAFQARQRLCDQELDKKTSALQSSEKARRQLQADLDDLKARLESETIAKSDENANRRKLATKNRDLQLRLEAEISKSNELAYTVALYKIRVEKATEKLEAAELGRLKAEKNEVQLKINTNELQESLDNAIKARRASEDQAKGLADRMLDLHDTGDVAVANKRLQEEINGLGDRHEADLEEREALDDQTRKKYQKEIKSLLTDLETEKNTSINLKESVRDLETEVESLNIKKLVIAPLLLESSAPLLVEPEIKFSKEEYEWRAKYMAASIRASRDRHNQAKLDKDERSRTEIKDLLEELAVRAASRQRIVMLGGELCLAYDDQLKARIAEKKAFLLEPLPYPPRRKLRKYPIADVLSLGSWDFFGFPF